MSNTIKIKTGKVTLTANDKDIVTAMEEAGYTVTKNYQAWRPEIDEYYEFLHPDGLMDSCTWDNDTHDLNRLAYGNVYPIDTGQAEKAAERQIATVRVLDRYRELEALEDDFDALYWGDSRQGKAYAVYKHSIGSLHASTSRVCQDKPSERYSSQAIIEQVSSEMENDVKLMIGICDEL